MAWEYIPNHCEPCTSSLEQAVESSQTYCWDTDPCALLKSSPIAERYCCNASSTESCHGSQSGTMSAPSTEQNGGGRSMSSAGDSHARTSVLLEQGRDSVEVEVDFGEKCGEWLAKYNQSACSWKTPQCLLFEDLEPSLETWPNWGMMLDGVCWEPTMSVLATTENAFGYWPTPTASDWKASGTIEMLKRQGDPQQAKGQNRPEYEFARRKNTKMPLCAKEVMMMWPSGWAALKPLETDRFQSWLQQHSGFCQKDLTTNTGEQ